MGLRQPPAWSSSVGNRPVPAGVIAAIIALAVTMPPFILLPGFTLVNAANAPAWWPYWFLRSACSFPARPWPLG
jgi:hypothetical protein